MPSEPYSKQESVLNLVSLLTKVPKALNMKNCVQLSITVLLKGVNHIRLNPDENSGSVLGLLDLSADHSMLPDRLEKVR